MTPTVVHNPLEKRFEYIAGNDVAVCEYKLSGNVWDFHHTMVPDSMRGMGVAGKLVETALRHVSDQNGKVIPTCSYVKGYIEKHPHFSSLLASD
jgi:predicted GNAT family acetyltransferase